MAQLFKGLMAVMLGNFFPQPFPEPFNGIEIRAVGWQRENLKAKPLGISAYLLAPMIGGTVPDNHDLAVRFAKPL